MYSRVIVERLTFLFSSVLHRFWRMASTQEVLNWLSRATGIGVTSSTSPTQLCEFGETFKMAEGKTWRSPSSPQIHQKYIYMWNNSYRTPTEHWKRPQTSQKEETSHVPGSGKSKKEKQRQKNRDGTCTSGREL